MRKARYISVVAVAMLMIGLSAGMVVGADRRAEDAGGSRPREYPRPGGSREGRDESDRREARQDREQPSRLRRLLHVKGLPPLRDEDRRPRRRIGVRRPVPLRSRTLHRAHYRGRTVYYFSFGYTRPRYYTHFYYGYPLVPRRDTDVNVYGLPSQEPYTQKDYKILEPKGQETPVEEVYASALSPMLGGPETVNPEFALAEDALRQGMLGLAVQDLRKLAMDNPDDPVPMLALGLTLFARDDLEDAAAALRAGMAVVPDPEAVRFDEPLVFGRGNTYELRIQEVAEGLVEHPDNADLQFLMGLHYFSSGDFAQAVEHLRRAEALDPADVASARLRALSMGHVAEAEKAAANPAEPANAATE